MIKKLLLILFIGFFFVRVNLSQSLPYTLFLTQNCQNLKRGDYILFTHPVNNMRIGKEIIGLEGDTIAIKENHIFIGETDGGQLLEKSPSGQVMTPIHHKEIPQGYVFVRGNHEQSFDSRYEEFGLIPISAIQEKLCPIF